ncbi:UNVERIFIED_CONTAM: hypothetical protein Slati_1173600 [Sesamum latifolium]|uniref:Endonuclease/exonuclease/phosphatase domain-containing protein n=1 Tax=Sesamum latifolium TaxID=2727402 RepID=A0AAW2XE77_9LAMI
MEEEASRLGRSLVLTESEDLGVVIPAGVWHSDPEKNPWSASRKDDSGYCYVQGLGAFWTAIDPKADFVDPGENAPFGPWLRAAGVPTLAPDSRRAGILRAIRLSFGLDSVLVLQGHTPHCLCREGVGQSLVISPIHLPASLSGGLALLWQKSVEVQFQSFSSFHIDTSVRLNETEECWRFSGIYGEPESSKRGEFWNLLRRLHNLSVRPWLCAGDFNEILEHSEKKGGPMRAEWQIRNFRTCIADCGLHDLGFCGDSYTWCNNQQPPHTVRERLDRACSSISWSQLFPAARVFHANSPYSDHTPLIIELQPKVKWDLSGCKKCFVLKRLGFRNRSVRKSSPRHGRLRYHNDRSSYLVQNLHSLVHDYLVGAALWS